MIKKISFYAALLSVLVTSGSMTVFAKMGEMGEQHRASTTRVVQELNKVAAKAAAVRDEVKSVADEEDTVSKSASEKIKAAESRNGFMTFLIGAGYKNLGALRSELMTTQNRIERLTKALDRVATTSTGTSTRAELETQISELKTILARAETFVKNQQGKFSLFGWMVRMFNK